MSICTFPMYDQNTARQMVSEFWKCLFNATVYMEFRVCFTFVKYEKIGCRYVRQQNVFIDAFLLFQNPRTSVRTD